MAELLSYEGDIRLDFVDGEGLMSMKGDDLERDGGLETAINISLFTDKLAGAEDIIPDGTNQRRGWWGDETFSRDESIGSLLWLLSRSKITTETLARMEEYAKEALAWMIEDGVAKEINVTVTRKDLHETLIQIQVVRPDDKAGTVFTYFYNWEAQIARRG